MWPSWAAPLGIDDKTDAVTLQTALADALRIAGTGDTPDVEAIAGIGRRLRPSLLGTPKQTDDILRQICELALILREEVGPIDYERRIGIPDDQLLLEDHWNILTASVGEAPGRQRRHLNARRYAFLRMSAAAPRDLPRPLQFRAHSSDAADHTAFILTMSAELKSAIDQYLTETEDHLLPALPGWLRALLPAPREPSVLDLSSDDQLTLRSPGGRLETFGSLPEAHEAARDAEGDLRITDAVLERFGDGPLVYDSEDGDGYSDVVFSYTDADRLTHLQCAYRDFLDIAKAYEADPTDFFCAWRFVDRHPAFWTAPDLDRRPWHWDVSGYASRLTLSVWRQDEELGRGGVGPVIVSREAGGHVPVDEQRGTRYRDHSRDWRLGVDAHSYEHAIILLAERVAMCFELDGSVRPADAVALDKPSWVTEFESWVDSAPTRNADSSGDTEDSAR